MSINMAEFHQVFFEESHEHLENMEQLLLALDLASPDPEELNTIFRAAHSIKGGSGIFGFTALTSVTHVMENLLDKTRKGNFQLTSSIIDLLLSTVDTLSHILSLYREEEQIDWQEVEYSKSQLVAALNGESFSSSVAVRNGTDIANTPVTPTINAEPSALVEKVEDQGFGFFEDEMARDIAIEGEDFGFFEEAYQAEEISAQSVINDVSNTEKVAVPFDFTSDDELGFGFFEALTPESFANEIELLSSKPVAPKVVKPTTVANQAEVNADSSQAKRGIFKEKESATDAKVSPAVSVPASVSVNPAPHSNATNSNAALSSSAIPKNTPSEVKAAAKKPAASGQDATLRVETSKIDTLVNLAGELVITQSMLTLIGNEMTGDLGERLKTALNELERNTREMQEAVMSVRMLPVSFVFNRFNRLVRDLSEQLGKNVNLVIEGGNTEIDKGMIEKLVDPLTHLVRNSLDHGIEKPEKRLAAGKSEVGVLSLKASQRGGNIVIAVHDNGAGLNRERIIQKARENGLQVADNSSDKQIWQLIFAAGFSTAVEVTDVSGRGVGMDVVRRNIEALGGRIDIESTEGQGSTFEIQLPLTLAIVDGMTVSVGNQIYILPLVHIIESIQPQTEQLKFLAKERLLKVREEYLPLLNLYQLMEIEPNAKSPEEGIVVLLESNHKRFGLCVDALVGQQQVVIKSLEKHYRRIPGVSGATIMGDGSVALILDVESLALHIKN
ncbi:chemotaxis protein CheA [Shewanella baltica]|uniref:chemotaxis protein CheA n=1 Tax=Shewanella baltica TaxID=62322 RepID=UPI00217E6280|nr:chemotaxis protein CheA [Shewanella baltica]MCS6125987.1 chemotaxis protein CheA [Shewanella baltica]MCS6138651.1 chemotaxis protein CheA [Shewanella baltica]MCS6144519.1 chemotaxis protein CheA [Shewanella baltica]MCS6169047.1 chemotaxis protein CheA [Shewanella baltica]MCS6185979.1 chemotaxis protein CheA [Shewanella baltica]